jgi:Predicted membrane protein (DUF2306)
MQKYALRLIQFVLLACLLWGSWLMLQLSLPYTGFEKNVDFLATKQLIYHLKYWRVSFYVHVFTSIFVLLAGFTQFSGTILHRYPLLHRRMGMSYIIIVLFFSGPASFLMAINANGGLPAKASFTLLSLCWFMATLLSYYYVRKKNYAIHGEWILRSYALSVSAITLRFYAYLFDVFNIHARPLEVYITVAWLSWVPNLIIAEIMIRKGFVEWVKRKRIN